MKKKKISKKANLVVCAVAFIIMIVYLVFVDSIDNVVAALSKINKGALILCVVFMIGYWLSEASTIHVMLKSMHPKMKFWNSWLTTIIGQYFNCITPSSTGGQPMQAYYLVKFGVPLGCGITALLSRFIVYQFVLTGYSIFTLAVGYNQFGDDLQQKGLMPFVLIGFIINTAVIVALLAIALFRKGTLKFANWLISLLTRMHIIKRPIKWRVYFTREVNKFYNNFKYLKKNIPLPGAMGGAELGYHGFFKDIFGEHYVNTAMMLWRIMTFYLPIIVGLFFTLTMKNKGIEEPQDGETEKMLYDMEQQTENDPEIK